MKRGFLSIERDSTQAEHRLAGHAMEVARASDVRQVSHYEVVIHAVITSGQLYSDSGIRPLS